MASNKKKNKAAGVPRAKSRLTYGKAADKEVPVPRAKKEPPKPPAAYVIDLRNPGFDGIIKFVEFIDGVGILSEEVIRKGRPDWFDKKGIRLQNTGVTLEKYVDWWRDKGNRVDPLSEDQIGPAMKRIRERKWRASAKKD